MIFVGIMVGAWDGVQDLHVLEGGLVEVGWCGEVDPALGMNNTVGAAGQRWRMRNWSILRRLFWSPNNRVWILFLNRVLVQWLWKTIKGELSNQRRTVRRCKGWSVWGHYTNDRVVVWDRGWCLVNPKLLHNLVGQECTAVVVGAAAAHDFWWFRESSFRVFVVVSAKGTYTLVDEMCFNFFLLFLLG